MDIKIAPSLLSADFAHLADEVKKVEEAGADWIHVDVMDGHFVPSLTIGPLVVEALNHVAEKPMDVHLMVESPENLLDAFAGAGAHALTVHVEACPHLHRVLSSIRDLGCKVGVALNPATPLSMIENVLDMVDLVLIMTVNPGFGGQKFISFGPQKVESAHNMIAERGLGVDIEVDGGINRSTVASVAAAGASILVAGTAVFGAADYCEAIKGLRRAATRVAR
ncbi:MAG: ribulose-phosphate 3-epimerase [Deltaproteobacteria bacterium]|nr:ribulose-phosphate 3-epimerase [Deltaproteobacteria bacterium]